MHIELVLGLISLATSTIAGLFGVGGGMLLIAVRPLVLPANLIIPLHSVIQLVSNVSRCAMGFRALQWQFVPGFLLGSVVGVGFFGLFFINLPSPYLPVRIGCFLLLSIWSPKFDRLSSR